MKINIGFIFILGFIFFILIIIAISINVSSWVFDYKYKKIKKNKELQQEYDEQEEYECFICKKTFMSKKNDNYHKLCSEYCEKMYIKQGFVHTPKYNFMQELKRKGFRYD